MKIRLTGPHLAAIRQLLHYSWHAINYNYDDLTDTEKACLSQDEFNEIVSWIKLEPGDRVKARRLITEDGSETADPNAKRLAPGWVHARAGEYGTVRSLDPDGYPTVEFDRTGSATITDFPELDRVCDEAVIETTTKP
jgi:hypothetical protein